MYDSSKSHVNNFIFSTREITISLDINHLIREEEKFTQNQRKIFTTCR